MARVSLLIFLSSFPPISRSYFLFLFFLFFFKMLRCRLGDLGVPERFNVLDSDTSIGKRVFGKSLAHLEEMGFHGVPLDMLHCVMYLLVLLPSLAIIFHSHFISVLNFHRSSPPPPYHLQ